MTSINVSRVRAVLFAKDLPRVESFYTGALGMTRTFGDADHTVLRCDDFELIVHQIPAHIAQGIAIAQPPARRTSDAVRLDYPVQDIVKTRALARSLGGDVDDAPPGWADPGENFFFGHDPEGNQFGVSERASP